MALDTSEDFYKDNSQAGLDKRLAQMQGINTASSPIATGFAALPDYAEQENAEKTARWALQDKASAFGYGKEKANPNLMAGMLNDYTKQFGNANNILGDVNQRLRWGYNRGGKIKGPGTTTSDSIPGQVKETGEPILVSQGERILSAKQDMLLGQIAQMLGFKTVDELLASGTGEPVGPSIKGGTKAAAQGAGPDDWMRVHQAGDRTSIDYHPQPQAPKMDPADAQLVQNASANFNKTFSDADFKKPDVPQGWVSNTVDQNGIKYVDVTPNYSGPLKQVASAILPVPNQATFDARRDAARAELQGGSPQPQAAPAPTTVPKTPEQQTQQAPTGAGTPGAQILGTQPLDLTGRQQQYMENNNIREFRDAGSGVIRTLDGKGNRVITNVGTGDITDPNKRLIDGNESAAIDRQGSTYNPFKQYENMLRLRMMSDATDPTITDPSVIARAQLGLNALNAQSNTQGNAILHAAQGKLANAQAGQADALTGQTKQIEALRQEWADPKTSEDRKKAIAQMMQIFSGHQAKTPEWKVGTYKDAMGNETPFISDGQNSYDMKEQAAATKSRQSAAQIPDVKSREIGKTYDTPKGKMIWRGNGWEPVK